MIKLEFGAKVKLYSYRKARVYGVFFKMDRFSEEGKALEKMLSKRAGEKHIDNHTVYAVTNMDGKSIYIACSDDVMRFGNILDEREWNW